MSNRSLFSLGRDLVDSIRGLKQATGDLRDEFRKQKLLKKDSPETREYVQSMFKSEDGQFIVNSGMLTKEEIATLSPVQLGNWLRENTALLGVVGRDVFTDMVSIPTAFGHDSDSKRTQFRSKPDTVPIEFGQCSD